MPQILNEDRREILQLEGKGFCLVESVVEALIRDYDVHYTEKDVINKISQELVNNLEYTTFLKSPVSQREVDIRMMEKVQSKTYSRSVCDLYLPAMATALDLHIRVIQNISGYYAILNILPAKEEKPNHHMKVINLILEDNKYSPVIYVGQDADAEIKKSQKVTAEVHSSGTHVQIIGYTPPPEKEVIIISETDEEDLPPPEITIESTPPTKEEQVPLTVDVPTPIVITPRRQTRRLFKRKRSQLEQDVDVLLDNLRNQEAKAAKEMDEVSLPTIPEVLPNIYKRLQFDMSPFRGMLPDVVDQIPHDIDGTHFYLIDVPEDDNFWSKYKDGRYFLMNTSSRKGFRGIRRIGKCRGNFICLNDSCPCYQQDNSRNQHQFKTVGNNKFCFSCDCLCYRKKCNAVKMIEYYHESRSLEVYHHGKHECQVRPNVSNNDQYVQRSLQEVGVTVGPKELAKIQMTKELQKQMESGETDMNAIIDIAAKLTNKQRIRDIKKRMTTQLKSEKHSLSAVAELKAICDTSDKYLIYKIHDSNMTGQGSSYVFKSSRKMAQLAINMDQNQSLWCPLMEEAAYFDGMHRRCEGWKTLTLWLFHPSSKRLNRIATMEVKGETSENCAKFWEILNEMMAEIKCQPGYKFNPKHFITDEAGANFNGIIAAYGQAGAQRAYTCQFHYKYCLDAMLAKFPPQLEELKGEFEMLMLQMLNVPTLSEYQEIKNRVKVICALVPAVEGQVDWWIARRYNIFPIFRGFCLTSLNMAEIGHSTLKKKKTLALVDAAWEDVCTAIMQEQEHTAFLAGRVHSSGKGPSSTQLGEKSKIEQMKRSRAYQEAFKEGRVQIGEEEGGHFIPAKKARHRPENSTVNIQGAEEGAPTSRPALSQLNIFNKDNPPLLCFLAGMKIKSCFGCKNKFNEADKTPPNDMVIKLQVIRDRLINNKWVPGWKKSWGYFHLNINCLKLEKTILEVDDIYIPTDTRVQLTPSHIEKLQKMAW